MKEEYLLTESIRRLKDYVSLEGDFPTRDVAVSRKLLLYSPSTLYRKFGGYRKFLETYLGAPEFSRGSFETSCTFCGASITKNLSDTNTSSNYFCNSSCAASFNNKVSKKRKPKSKTYCRCGVVLYGNRNSCRKCQKEDTRQRNMNLPVSHFTRNKGANRYNYIRQLARKEAELHGLSECYLCGYSTHVEICHKKPISAFPPTALLKEVNDIDNLVALCPTHHWELDNGVVSL